jgi:hypothetical protein
MGCNSSSENIYLSCNGFSDTINVYGTNIEEKKEPLIIPVEIERKNSGIWNYFDKPKYQVRVSKVLFKEESIFSDKTILVGQNDPNRKDIEFREQTFHLNRNTNHLIFKDSYHHGKTSKQLNQQYTINFEGKCEKVKEKI